MTRASVLALRIDSEPGSSDDFFVTVLVDGVAVFESTGQGSTGPYADEFDLPVPTATPARTLLAVCVCRNPGCDDLAPLISVTGGSVYWRDFRRFTGWEEPGELATAKPEHGHPEELLPLLWAWFTEGEVSTQNAREAAIIVSELSAGYSARLETQIVDAARTLAPARFRTRARAIREKLHAETLTERREAAEVHRGMWIEPDRDGMGWLHAHLSSEKLAMISANLDGVAFDVFAIADEERTMAQLRADVLSDLLTGAGTHSKVGVTVAVTIPVLSVLGHSDQPAVLEGVGPIDIETARRLCATTPSITRLLTDPVTGTVLQMDAHQYRPSAALKRWLAIQQVTCDFPGCGRRAAHCDLDHTHAWAEGGPTSAHNLTHRCRKHHTMKHQTRWRVERPPDRERAVWTSPTGYRRESDPPPF